MKRTAAANNTTITKKRKEGRQPEDQINTAYRTPPLYCGCGRNLSKTNKTKTCSVSSRTTYTSQEKRKKKKKERQKNSPHRMIVAEATVYLHTAARTSSHNKQNARYVLAAAVDTAAARASPYRCITRARVRACVAHLRRWSANRACSICRVPRS